MLVNTLRDKHPRFIFDNFWLRPENNDLKIGYEFRIEPDISFTPEVVIENINQPQLQTIPKQVLDKLAFHLGLMEIPSYWKATCSSQIIIKPGSLNQSQIQWWHSLIMNGLGQFFYTNQIDFQQPNFLEITTTQNNTWPKYEEKLDPQKILVPVGGGKDSIVTLETLKKTNKTISCLSLNPTRAALEIMQITGCQKPIIVRRKIDNNLLKLNQKGYLNGHTPFTAYLAFLSVTCAVLFNYSQVAISNERSANEGNLLWLGQEINHQYAKTFEFEQSFNSYAREHLASNIHYFSFLEPLWEIQIAKLLAGYPKYFSAFKSCNQNQKNNSWCNNCPKCLSVFIALSPFLDQEDLLKVFGEDLFRKESLLPTLKELLGETGCKPFECVSTREETLVALYLALEKRKNSKSQLPLLLKSFQEEVLPKHQNLAQQSQKLLNSWGQDENLPEDLRKILKNEIV